LLNAGVERVAVIPRKLNSLATLYSIDCFLLCDCLLLVDLFYFQNRYPIEGPHYTGKRIQPVRTTALVGIFASRQSSQ
jgi:hypothetical protein